jgi:O-antigen/teichoic acid export membrane protein
MRRGGVWVLFDQAMVTGCNFLTNIYMVRKLGLESFGVFVILYAWMLLAWTWQFALFITPMMSLTPMVQDLTERKAYLLGMNTLQFVFALPCGLFLLSGAIAVRGAAGMQLAIALASAGVLFQLQEMVRRYLFAAGRAGAAFANDAISYLGQLVLLGLFAGLRMLNVTSCLWAIGVSSGAAVAVALLSGRLLGTLRQAKTSWVRSKQLAFGLFLSSQLTWANSQGLMMLLSVLVNPAASGVLKISQTVTGPFNVFFLAMENAIPGRASEHFILAREKGLFTYLTKLAFWGEALMLIPCLAIALLSGVLTKLILKHPSHELAVQICLQSAYSLLGLSFRLVTYFFRTLQKPGVLVSANVLLLTGSVSVTLLFASRLGAIAAGSGLVLGEGMALLYLYAKAKKITSDAVNAELGIV